MRTLRRMLAPVALTGLLALSAPLRAEMPNMSLSLGLSGGGHFVLDRWHMQEIETDGQLVSPGHTGILKGRAGFQPFSWLSLELGAAWIPAPAGDINAIFSYEGDLLVQPFDFDALTPFLDVGGGAYHNATPDWRVDAVFPQAHWGLGVRYLVLDWLALRAEARHVMTQNLPDRSLPFANNLEVTVGADFFAWIEDKDADDDGIVDGEDRCPEQAGPASTGGCPDRDGDGIADGDDRCPDSAGPAAHGGCPDRDGDGLIDSEDSCPGEPGPAERQGCPARDRDGDGVVDEQDSCPDTAGLAKLKGCPDTDGDGITDRDDRCPEQAGPAAQQGCPDSDGDGIADPDDKCPSDPGTAEWQGCPPPTKEVIKKFSGTLKGIKFKTGSAEIDPSSAPVLDDAAKTLKEWPGVRVVIEGHTDDRGGDAFNQKLSEDRANSVRQYLIDKGVPSDQLEAAGYGETKPIGDNKTKEGRFQNRRIEFNIIKR